MMEGQPQAQQRLNVTAFASKAAVDPPNGGGFQWPGEEGFWQWFSDLASQQASGLSADVGEFLDSVDWRSDGWWLMLLASFHLQYFAWLAFLSLEAVPCFLLFALNSAFCSFALPYLNVYLHNNWESLGMSARYFDEYGFFATTVIGMPLVCINLLLLFKILSRTISLAVQVKRTQLFSGKRQDIEKSDRSRCRGQKSDRNGDQEGKGAVAEEENAENDSDTSKKKR